MRAGQSILAACVLAACAAQPSADERDPDLSRVTVWFEQALPEPGALRVLHESGYQWSGPTTRTGAVFSAPQGPCTLVLEIGGVVADERSFHIRGPAHEYEWRRSP